MTGTKIAGKRAESLTDDSLLKVGTAAKEGTVYAQIQALIPKAGIKVSSLFEKAEKEVKPQKAGKVTTSYIRKHLTRGVRTGLFTR